MADEAQRHGNGTSFLIWRDAIPGGARQRAFGDDEGELLPVVGQNLRAGLAEPGAVLLEARQHDLVTVIHTGAAEPRHIPHTLVMPRPLLRRGR
jgi:hypothetical protein